jgi:hypothetical protein
MLPLKVKKAKPCKLRHNLQLNVGTAIFFLKIVPVHNFMYRFHTLTFACIIDLGHVCLLLRLHNLTYRLYKHLVTAYGLS